MSLCLDYYNVYAGDSRDSLKRERFIVLWPEQVLFNKFDPNLWYWQMNYRNDDGLDCCSNYTISFHYINAPYQ